LLISCAKEDGKALIVATHDMELASLCDHCYVLKDGLLFQEEALRQ
jgi:ABC-type lipoprotein export system ATPase subunit